MAKRAATTTAPAPTAKKTKAAAAAAPASTRPKRAAATKAKAAAAPETVVDTVKKIGKKVAAEINEAIDHAGDIIMDDVAPTPEAAEVKPKGKKAAAGPKAVADSKKRKTADDFMGAAEKAATTIVDKVGAALEGVVREFGEASGLMEKTKDTKGKKAPAAAAAATKKAPAKKAAAAKAAEPESESESFIGAFETDEEEGGADSSDDESDAEDEAVRKAGKEVQAGKIPHAKDDKTVQARLKRANKKKSTATGTIFLGRIPHGFYEEQMKDYFSQFGDVTRLRLARNPKTGASRHYAYIEFSSLPVAEIVADTMNNYLLMGHLLRCNVIPSDEVHPELWVGANKKFRKVPRARLEKMRQDKPRTAEQQEKANAKVLKRQEERREKIKAAGIDYEFEGHK
ncbi:putative RNA-binding protein [Vanrija pseudolonga]|uniref:Purtative RNA-binding protein n=1 Tax=Vanrija pseudolonga TaxID=143232 RepID=A0AAF0YG08_9TREE|nr:purtative RNA-binding protein [Vanrija pseudolonga]